jgi:CRP-like cAMP-binding protein
VLKLTRSDLAPTDAFRRRGIERTLSKMQQLPFLRDFVVTREHLAEFSAFCDPLVFEKGETLLAKGRSEHYMLLLLSGSVDVLVAPPRKVVIVAPEFVGEACLANPGRKRGASVIAATRVEALKLTRLRLFRLYEHFKTRGAGDSVRRAMDKLVFKAGGQTSIIELRVACDAHTQKQEGQRRARSSGVVAKASAVGPLLPADGTAADDAAAVNAAAAAAEREESLLESLESSVNDNASRRATVLLSTAASAEASRTAASRRATVVLRPAVASSEMSASRRATTVLSIARAASSSARSCATVSSRARASSASRSQSSAFSSRRAAVVPATSSAVAS